MKVIVRLPAPLRAYADSRSEVELRAATVGAALDGLTELYPPLRRHLYAEDGALRSYVNVFLNEDDVRTLEGPDTAVEEGDVVMIVPSIAGGAAGAAEAARALSREEVARYSRHIVMPEVGWEGQRKLKEARVLLIGAGGLGSPLGLYLAAAGVGTIGMVDFDVVDESNLHRQVLYGQSDVGRPKLEAAMERLRDVNPHIELVPHSLRLTSENALEIFADYDIIVDGSDNFPTRYLVNDACVLLGKPNVFGSILRFEGQVSTFGAPGGPCYRCLFREPPPPGLVPNCAEGGVIGVLPGIIGTLQALETIKLILGEGDTLVGRLVLFDALTMRFRELKLKRNPDCPACGDRPTVTELIDYEEFCGLKRPAAAEGEAVPQIEPMELKERLDRGESITILDVREPHEWEISNLGALGARLIPMRQVDEHIDELDKDAEIVVHCLSGGRSERVAARLREAGFERVSNLRGGILAWSDEVDPSVRKY